MRYQHHHRKQIQSPTLKLNLPLPFCLSSFHFTFSDLSCIISNVGNPNSPNQISTYYNDGQTVSLEPSDWSLRVALSIHLVGILSYTQILAASMILEVSAYNHT